MLRPLFRFGLVFALGCAGCIHPATLAERVLVAAPPSSAERVRAIPEEEWTARADEAWRLYRATPPRVEAAAAIVWEIQQSVRAATSPDRLLVETLPSGRYFVAHTQRGLLVVDNASGAALSWTSDDNHLNYAPFGLPDLLFQRAPVPPSEDISEPEPTSSFFDVATATITPGPARGRWAIDAGSKIVVVAEHEGVTDSLVVLDGHTLIEENRFGFNRPLRYEPTGVEISFRKNFIAARVAGGSRVWNVGTGQELFPGRKLDAVAFSPVAEEALVLSGAQLERIDLSTGSPLEQHRRHRSAHPFTDRDVARRHLCLSL